MKKYLYSVIIALIAISCSESEDPVNEIVQNTPSNAPESIEAEIPRVESRAVWKPEFESWEGTESIHSRTYAVLDQENTNEYYQYWHEGDAISLFTTTQNMQYVLVSGATKDMAKFEPGSGSNNSSTGENLSTGNYYSVYPYKENTTITTDGQVTYTFPETQIYAQKSYAKDYNGLMAKEEALGTDNVYEFKNFCSYLQLKLRYDEKNNKDPEINKKVYKIILKSNETHEYLSGIGAITYEGNEPVVTMDHENSNNEIILDCRGKGVELSTTDPTEFWFVLPGEITFSKGFNITVIFEDGSYYQKSTQNKITIHRNHITPMVPLNITDIKTSVIRYQYEEPDLYNNKGDEFPFPKRVEEGYPPFMDENGDPLQYEQIYDEDKKEWIVTFFGVLATINGNIFDDEYYTYPDLSYIIIDNSKPITLNSHAFYTCTAEKITIINDIIDLGENNFRYSDVKEIEIVGDVYNISDLGFANTTKLQKLNIQGRVDKIGASAFSGSSIAEIIIEDRINHVGVEAFQNCTNLTTIKMHGIEHIEDRAFEGCENLGAVDLTNVHKIGVSAFAGCSSLTTIDISSNCISIGEGAFVGCRKLKTINMLGKNPPTLEHDNGDKANPFIFPNGAKIYVPDGAYSTYDDNSSWYFYSSNNHETDYQATIVKS